MVRMSWTNLKAMRLCVMSADERASYERASAEARFAFEVGARIREARKAAGLSQRELAQRMGTSQASIGRLESGTVSPTLATLQRAATALGLVVDVELHKSA